MSRLFVILLVLLLALAVVVPLLERFSRSRRTDAPPAMARWVMPLIMLLLILQILAYWFV